MSPSLMKHSQQKNAGVYNFPPKSKNRVPEADKKTLKKVVKYGAYNIDT